MFSGAYGKACQFTRPVIVSTRNAGGEVATNSGSFVIVNNEGWFVTAAHLLLTGQKAGKDKQMLDAHRAAVAAIEADTTLTHKLQRRKLAKLAFDPKWIETHSFWWGRDDTRCDAFIIDGLADLAIGQLKPWDPSWITTYPRFRDPASSMAIASMLCRLGYPFPEIKPQFDPTTRSFRLDNLQVPIFPNSGLYARNVTFRNEVDGREVRLFELDSPGLPGQSGGPIVDERGDIWGIQSRTMHHPLGFNPKIKVNGKEFEEQQFLNTGLAVHVAEVLRLLREHNVRFEVSTGEPATGAPAAVA